MLVIGREFEQKNKIIIDEFVSIIIKMFFRCLILPVLGLKNPIIDEFVSILLSLSLVISVPEITLTEK